MTDEKLSESKCKGCPEFLNCRNRLENCKYVESLEQELDRTSKAAATLQQALDYCVDDKRSLMQERDALKEQLEDVRALQATTSEQLRNALNDCVFHHKRAEKAETRVKELIGINSGLSELTQGMDYCAEESDKKRKDAEDKVKELTKAYDKVYDELTRTNQAILNHEENKYVVEDLAKTYTRIRDAEDRLSKAQELPMPAWTEDRFKTKPQGIFETVFWDKDKYFKTLEEWHNELKKALGGNE